MRRTQATDCRTLPFGPDRVWAALVDFAGYPRWWPQGRRLRVLRVMDGLVGSRFEVGPRGGRFVCEVAGVLPSREMRIAYVGGVHRGTGVWTLEPAGAGTRVCYAVDLEPHGWAVQLLSNFLDFGKMHSRAMGRLFDGLEGCLRRGEEGGRTA
jgi:uncharacterized protein YndB with AHSA1/START domain